MFKRSDFWRSCKVLLQYKRQLAIAGLGITISSLSFGAGLTMLLPIMKLFFREKQTLAGMVQRALERPDLPQSARPWLEWMSRWAPTGQFQGLLWVLGGIALLTVIGGVGRYLHELMAMTVATWGSADWRQRVMARLLHAPLEHSLKHGSADAQSRIIVDVGYLNRAYLAVLSRATLQIAHGFVAIVMAFVLNWALTLVGMLGAPLIFVLLNQFGRRIRRAAKRALLQQSKLLSAVREALGAPLVVKLHDAEGYERRRLRRANKRVVCEQLRRRQAEALSSPVIETLTVLGVLLVIVAAGWYVFVHRPGTEPERFMTTIAMLVAAGVSLKPLTNLNNRLKEADAAAQRVLQMLETPLEPIGREVRCVQPSLRRHRHEVRFEAVTYHYPGSARPAVRDVTLRVEHGQTMAIVGPNGSGKTTLVTLLPRLLEPQRGRVLIDGVDVATVNLRSLRGQMAMVTQQSVLFEGTVAENIAYGRGHEPKSRIIAAARSAHADDFIQQLPQGYDTRLGEDGSGLSGGQRQRLCIARAVLRNPAILILDEATSQIDADSEAKINAAIRELRVGRTTFVIAHRLSTVIDADVIAVMQDGRLIDLGRHDELLARCTMYQSLTQTQLQPA